MRICGTTAQPDRVCQLDINHTGSHWFAPVRTETPARTPEPSPVFVPLGFCNKTPYPGHSIPPCGKTDGHEGGCLSGPVSYASALVELSERVAEKFREVDEHIGRVLLGLQSNLSGAVEGLDKRITALEPDAPMCTAVLHMHKQAQSPWPCVLEQGHAGPHEDEDGDKWSITMGDQSEMINRD